MLRHIGLSLMLIVSGLAVHAQADRPYLGETDTEALKQMAAEFQKANEREMERAKAIAREANIPLRQVTSDGNVITVSGVNSFGLLEFTISENLDAAKTTRTDELWYQGGLGLNLAGKGYDIGEWDGGKVYTQHQDLTGRVTQKDNASTVNEHATHVAGTLVGSDSVNQARGMAYKANLEAYDWNSDNSEMSTAASGGLLVSNHSYGPISGWRYKKSDSNWYWYGTPSVSQKEDWRFGFYTNDARNWDQIANSAPYYLIVKSAGNDRNDDGPTGNNKHFVRNQQNQWVQSTKSRNKDGSYDCIAGKATAKNILTVGAVNDLTGQYSGPSDVSMTTFSGWGPTDDGRIKPDIVANGRFLKSCGTENPSDYTRKSGTSMSSPNAAGSMLLLQEHYHNIHNQQMRAATLKGLVIHTAEEAGPAPGPDYQFGWGLMNAADAAKHISNKSGGQFLLEKQLQNQDTFRFKVNANSKDALKATLCWNDPAGNRPSTQVDPSTKILVNDLDLRIQKTQSNKVFKPFVMDPANPDSAASRGDNSRDNVEQVLMKNPKAGTYTVEVTHEGNLSNPQAFSLAITAAGKGCQAPSGLALDSVKSQSAWIQWTSFASQCPANAKEWKVQWGKEGFALGQGDSMAVTNQSANLSGLNPLTTYDVYVAEIRTNNKRTAYVGPLSFKTPPKPVQLPYKEGFENFSGTYTQSGSIKGPQHALWEFQSSTPHGRLRFHAPAIQASSGTRAATMDVNQDQNMTANNLILNLNMTNYTTQRAIFLSFDHREYDEEEHPNDSVWIRGHPQAEWIGLYDLFANASTQFQKAGLFNISKVLRQHGQAYSQRFQVRFGQQDNYTLEGRLKDGRGFDNIRIIRQDLAVQQILQPGSYCGLTSSEQLKVIVKNTGLGTVKPSEKVDLFFQVNNGPRPVEPLNLQKPLKPGDTVHYTFQQAADLAVGQGPYNLLTGLIYPADQVAKNDTIRQQIAPLPSPSVDFNSTLACEGSAVTIKEKVDAKGGQVTAFNWKMGDGTQLQGPNVQHSYSKAGSYSVTLAIQTQNQCRDSATKGITVQPTPKANYAAHALCGLDSIAFESESSPNGSTIQSYQWAFGDGQTGQSRNVTHAYGASKTYNVRLTVESKKGCLDTFSSAVPVSAKPDLAFSVPKACEDVPLVIQNNSTIRGDQDVTYQWDLGRGQQSSQKAPSPVYDSAGSVKLQLKGFTEMDTLRCSEQIARQVTIHPKVKADFSTLQTGPGEFTLTPADKSAMEYHWTFGNGDTSMRTAPTVSYDSNAGYEVRLVTETQEGCMDTGRAAIDVQTVGTPDQLTAMPFKVYPNPVNASDDLMIRFQLKTPQNVRVKLFNQQGRQVRLISTGLHSQGEHTVQVRNLEALSRGVYTVQMVTAQNTRTKRIILLDQ